MCKFLFFLLIPFFIFSQTPCLDAVANATGLIGEFIPQCEDDGSYSPMQCWPSTGYCWCVDENGVEIPGSSMASWEGFPNCSENLCEGVNVVLESFNESNIEIIISTENNPNFWCNYCGLMLIDNNENIVAIENPWTAPSFYGLAGGYSELRTLDIISNINLPFEGELHAVNGLMPNVNVDENYIIDANNPIDVDSGDIPFTMCSWLFQLNTESILGCLDIDACNYNPVANEDDGSCLYESDALSNPIEITYVEEFVSGEIGETLMAPIHIRNSSCDSMTNLVVSKIFSPENIDVSVYFCFNEICFTSLTNTAPNPLSLSAFEENDYFKGYLISDISGVFEVTYEFYLEDNPSIFKQKTIIYCVDNNCFESNVEKLEKNKNPLRTVNILGKESQNKGFQLQIFDDGSVEKKYLIK